MREVSCPEDCADCLCRVCARNIDNDSYHPQMHKGRECSCDCNIGDEHVVETDSDCPDFLADITENPMKVVTPKEFKQKILEALQDARRIETSRISPFSCMPLNRLQEINTEIDRRVTALDWVIDIVKRQPLVEATE